MLRSFEQGPEWSNRISNLDRSTGGQRRTSGGRAGKLQGKASREFAAMIQ